MTQQTTQTPKKPRFGRFLAGVLGIAIGLGAVLGAVWLWQNNAAATPGAAVWKQAGAPGALPSEAPVQAPARVSRPAEAVEAAQPEPAPVDPNLAKVRRGRELLDGALAAYEDLRSYQAVFDTSELNDKGEWENETCTFRFEKPFTMYMAYTAGKKNGMQLLYAQDKFNDDIHVRMPGFLFKMVPLIAISPDDPRVVGKNKHSIRKAGLGAFLEEFGGSFSESEASGKMKILALDDVEIEGEPATLVDINYGLPFEYPRTSVAFSKRTGLPLEVKLYADQKKLVESYRYLDLVVDPARNDAGFAAGADPRIVEKFFAAATAPDTSKKSS